MNRDQQRKTHRKEEEARPQVRAHRDQGQRCHGDAAEEQRQDPRALAEIADDAEREHGRADHLIDTDRSQVPPAQLPFEG